MTNPTPAFENNDASGYQQYPTTSWGNEQSPAPATKNGEPGFFAALFDLSFSHFITVKFAKYIYTIMLVLYAVLAVGVFITTAADSFLTALAALIIMAIFGLFFAISLRLWLESAVAWIRTAENTTQIRNHLTGR
ncbi:MAG: DUF4282 domain-containing protein [Corynebacterium sp.]|nr:DUF4282 domain-containing protein [Corynebacterium sp.]